jgi:putative ABC transport system permease protein
MTFFGRRTPRSVNAWLALFTLCAVFAATVGVREALATRTQALRQTMAAAPALTSTITVSGTWGTIMPALGGAARSLSGQQASEIAARLRGDLNKGVVPLAPASADWAALTTQLNAVSPAPPSTHGTAVQLEIAFRQPLRQHVRLVAGAFPASPVPASDSAGNTFYPVLPVLVTQQTAARFALTPGSTMRLAGITLTVSGIVAPRAADSAFWTSDPTVVAPTLNIPLKGLPYWAAGVLAAPGEGTAVQADFGHAGIYVQWTFPIAVGELNGSQAQPADDALTALGNETLPLSPDLAQVASQLTASSALVHPLASFIASAQSADVVLWLLYVSLTVAGLVAALLAGRMVVLRRSGELAVVRARGASLWRLAGTVAGEAAVACVPAAVAAVALAVLAVPAAGGLEPPGSAGAWWPVAAVPLVAVCGPAVMAAWRNRPPRRRPGVRRQRARVRPAAEVTLTVAAAGGILVFRQQGLQPGSGVNLYTSAAPVLIAVPAVIVVFRLYPLVLRGLLRAAARTSGAPAFLGLARAARAALTPALPAFALVLALTVAAFGGMVRDAVTSGEVAASWQVVGADAAVTPSPAAEDFTIAPATARAIAAVPGVTHAARVWQATWSSPGGKQITGIAVDPAAYAALVAATTGYPPVPAGALAAPSAPGAPQPVLASPSAAATLGKGTALLSTTAPVRPVDVRVAGTLSGTPALPPGSLGLPGSPSLAANPAFVVMPFTALKSSAIPPAPVVANEMLLTGTGIDRARLAAVMRQGQPGGEVTFRSDVLAGLRDAPLQHGAVTVITLSVIVSALLGLAVMLLELALGAADREVTLARLATMGLGAGQRARVVALELLPAVIAAAITAWACAVALPPVVAPVIDLSVFTGSSAAVPLVPDVAAVALPLAGLLVLAAVSLGIELGTGRRRGAVSSSLRVGG